MTLFNGSNGNDIFTGGSDGDTAVGNGGNDTLSGAGGNDLLVGNSGSDILNGGDGDDRLFSGDESPPWSTPYFNVPYTPPLLDTGTEQDTLNGGDGADTIFAGYGDNVDGGLDGSFGDRLLISFLGASAGITADFHLATQVIGGGTITGIENITWVQGSNFGDYIDVGTASGNGYSDFTAVFGMGGNDQLLAGYYTGVLDGGDGDDIVDGRGSQYLQAVYGGNGNDILYTNSNTFGTAWGGAGNDTIYAHGETHGGDGDDRIVMTFSYYGGRVYGDAGNDQIDAAGQGSTIAGGSGADIINGNAGADSLSSADFGDYPVTFTDDIGLEVDVLAGFGGNDLLAIGYGDSADGGSGTDTLRLSLAGLTTGITLSTSIIASGQPFELGGGIIQNIENFEYLRGTEFADVLTLATQSTQLTVNAGGGNDLITSGASSVNVNGGEGDDRFNSGIAGDIFDGGAGIDLVDYQLATEGVTVSLGLNGQAGSGGGGDQLLNVEYVFGSNYDDVLNGNELANWLAGQAGADTLNGLEGNDVLVGGAGDDTLYGGAGNDSLDGGLDNDSVFGGDGDDSITGVGGDDVLDGGNGLDLLSYRLATSGVTVSLAVSGPQNTGSGLDNISNFEWLEGSQHNDILTGSSGANFIFDYEGGDDQIFGGGGNDAIEDRIGNDVIDGGDGDDFVDAGDGNDTVYGGAGADRLFGGDGDDRLEGGDGNDLLSGEGGNNILIGGAGNDTLSGGILFTGGSGNDTFSETRSSFNGDTITDFGWGDRIVFTDATLAGFSFSLSGNTLTYTGGSLTLSAPVNGPIVARAASGGGVELTIVQPFSNPNLVLTAFGYSAGGWTSDDRYHRVMADVNGDGRADIVGFGNQGAFVALGNANGTFAPSQLASPNFGVSASAGGWASNDIYPRHLADVNNDGRADIVAFGENGTLVALGQANGSFGAAFVATGQFGRSTGAGGWTSDDRYHRTLGDVNGDGRADIVGFGNDGVYVSLANANGTFGTAQVASLNFGYSVGAGGWISDDRYPRTLADVNGDNRADIIAFGEGGTYVALGQANGTFGAAFVASGEFGRSTAAGAWTSNDVYYRELADVNNDGRADIVGFGQSAVYVALGQANGTFAPSQVVSGDFGSGPEAGGWGSQDVFPRHLADINNDGFVDLVGFGAGGVYVSLANGEHWV